MELRAKSFFGNGDFAEAIKDYDVLISRTPTELKHYFARGLCWLGRGEPAKALKELKNALGLSDPPCALLLLRTAQSHYQLRNDAECIAAVGKALAALATEDANADAAEQSGVIYRRPCSDVDKLEGGDVALGHSSALAAECHAARGLAIARRGGKGAAQRATAEYDRVLVIEGRYITRRLAAVEHLPLTDARHKETVAELVTMYGDSADVVEARARSLLAAGDPEPKELAGMLSAIVECGGQAAGGDGESIALRHEAKQRLCWAHTERLALAARSHDTLAAALGAPAVRAAAETDGSAVLKLQDELGLIKGPEVLAAKARSLSRLSMVLKLQGAEPEARAQMDHLIAALPTVRPIPPPFFASRGRN